MANSPEHSLLGQQVVQSREYDPGLLYPIPRRTGREAIGLTDPDHPPFGGVDVWNLYELSWLDANGKPVVALGVLSVPASSPFLVESKSLKLYLNSLNFMRFAHRGDVVVRVESDLSDILQAPVQLVLFAPDQLAQTTLGQLPGDCLDDLPLVFDADTAFAFNPLHLQADSGHIVEEALHSNLLRSTCPVTGQPDWASVLIRYRGPAINHGGLLRYLVSYREHSGFHEQCVEQIFIDLLRQCEPFQLTVYARYTRRGGIDINPFRSSHELYSGNIRLSRQ